MTERPPLELVFLPIETDAAVEVTLTTLPCGHCDAQFVAGGSHDQLAIQQMSLSYGWGPLDGLMACSDCLARRAHEDPT